MKEEEKLKRVKQKKTQAEKKKKNSTKMGTEISDGR